MAVSSCFFKAGDQMVFIPDSFDNTYVITHWTNPSNYSLVSVVFH